jgi:hypothetical protein
MFSIVYDEKEEHYSVWGLGTQLSTETPDILPQMRIIRWVNGGEMTPSEIEEISILLS